MGFCVKAGLLIVTFLSVVSQIASIAKLPSSFGRCSVKDPEMDKCLAKNVEDAIHLLKADTPELGLATLDPLDIPELVIGEGTGPVNVVQNFKNIKLHGLTSSSCLDAHFDSKNNILTARSITPELRLQGKYSMKGKVLLLPIYGDGDCNITLINTKINHTILGETVEKKGHTFFNIYNYTVTLRPEKMIYKFDNLFNGDRQLGEQVLNVLNDNWNEVFTDVRDGYEKSFGLIFHGLGNRVFSRVPLKDIFLDLE
ncbi:protein takeout-like [Diorhabda sublineata]|uniref:protein takeout-like n=1 Tax=Diorhabda sublineata TaxID=1163346 RepID=UPI0024E0BB8A|nr:protein takeout-like [Diorhabda sublineata]